MPPKKYNDISNPYLEERFNNIEKKLDNITKILDELPEKYVTLREFSPIQKLVYGIVALILSTIIGGMVSFYVTNAVK